jgi:hypothetical protein
MTSKRHARAIESSVQIVEIVKRIDCPNRPGEESTGSGTVVPSLELSD